MHIDIQVDILVKNSVLVVFEEVFFRPSYMIFANNKPYSPVGVLSV